ncbi:uncharacterized protein LOC130655445 [Hydractinia symbiolongicarpus]|uniref:uncharacterized protein LOC130655445 n=1 Tax=Hydractinia symbiolongicarpus TaxID=13093 RepID=UPI0025500B54|nr:uncharacterized protein LOC130655445 [Hydractinia symbiolongicarpus]
MKSVFIIGIVCFLLISAFAEPIPESEKYYEKSGNSTGSHDWSDSEPEGETKAEPEVEPEVVYGVLGALLACFVIVSILFFLLWRQAKSMVEQTGANKLPSKAYPMA